MRAPLSWMLDFAPFEGPAADLAATLDDLGLVVEGIETIGEGLDDVLVARIDAIEAIEGADRIRAVTVEAGDGQRRIVCGADNFSIGDLVPLAPVGAVLPGGFEIKSRKMKGVVSDGMLCSAAELGISTDAAGLLLLPSAPLGSAISTLFPRDTIFDITVEGDRPDAWSIAGIARDLAARLHVPFAIPELPTLPRGSGAASVTLEAPDLCPRFLARVHAPVDVGASPDWLARRLLLAGMRPINHVVDASNYVMLEFGQPTHPYDLDALGGHGLLVRRSGPNETLITLDGIERLLEDDCLICDDEGTPVGIGGVMGGRSSEVTSSTTRILLEAAYFAPLGIARTSSRLALRTEASARFERGTDPWGLERALDRCGMLIGAPVGETIDVRGTVPEPHVLNVSMKRVNRMLGTEFSVSDVAALIEPIGFRCDTETVTVPTDRPDVRTAPHGVADVIEEIARTYGYAKLPRRKPSWPASGGLTRRQRERRFVADVCCGLGLTEAWTSTFVSDAQHVEMGLDGTGIRVTNPLVAEEAMLRRSLLPGLLDAIAYNSARRQADVRLFEMGVVFLPDERDMLAAVFADADEAVAAWRVLGDALGVDAMLVADGTVPGTHPTRTARLVAAECTLGVVGEVDPSLVDGRVGWLEVDLGLLLDTAPRRSPDVQPVSKYPSSDVDLAFVVPDAVPAGAVADVLAAGELVESAYLFDVYRVDSGQRSLAFHLRFCAPDRTLTDTEVSALRQACIDAVFSAFGAELR